MEALLQKEEKLKELLATMGSVAVAFSGGVDSTYLLALAQAVLKEKVVAVTVESAAIPEEECQEAAGFCRSRGIRQVSLQLDALTIPGFCENSKDRCYFCKHGIFSKILAAAQKERLAAVAEGSNVDDLGDYRPGMRAIAELGVHSPLKEAGLTKAEIRQLSKRLGLSTASKPSMACLASRIPYGEEITREKLARVAAAEAYLFSKGFSQLRVRSHGDLARLELLPAEMERFMASGLYLEAQERLKKLGFSYVCLDLKGYRTGSLNEVL